MKIQLLYFDGCPSWETALQNLKTACALEGLPAEIDLVEVKDDDDAVRLRFLGSPSIVLDGQDLWPETRKAYYMSCRIYPGLTRRHKDTGSDHAMKTSWILRDISGSHTETQRHRV